MGKRLLGLALLPIVAFVLFTGWSAVQSRKADEDLQVQKQQAPGGLLISGLHYKTKKDGFLVSEIEADSLTVLPKRIFLFQVKSVNEAVLTNASIKLFLSAPDRQSPGEGRADFEVDPVGTLFREFNPAGRQAGFITNAKVLGVNIDIFHEGVLTQHVSAASAAWGGNGSPKFHGGTVEEFPSRKRTTSDSISWDARRKKFRPDE